MNAVPGTIARRHDLDSLRAAAMLLGIVLHGALSFIPASGWAVQDAQQNATFAVLLALIHGFRMQLFFLVSGFFTAMLWRKRGLQRLVQHRCLRILLPLVLGMVTIVPATWVVTIAAGVVGEARRSTGADARQGPAANLWSAAAAGDVEQLKGQLEAEVDPDAWDPNTGATPLATAVWHGHNEAVEVLLAAGADVNGRCRDRTTPLLAAAFFGRAEVAETLLTYGADVTARNERGDSVASVITANWEITEHIASLIDVNVNREQVDSGRQEIRALLNLADGRSIAAEESLAEKKDPLGGLRALVMGAMLFPFFHHLWFLWFLCLFVVAFCVYAAVIDHLPWKLPSWLVLSPARYLWLIPLTLVPQAAMGLLYPSFGPDTSVGLLPMPWVLAYYAIFFMFGAIYFDHDDATGRVGRWWWLTLPLALFVVFPVGYELTMQRWGFGEVWVASAYRRPLSVLLQATYAWLMTFGAMGMFRSLFAAENKVMRYMSDSSYWLYLVHLPLIIVVQLLVCSWLLPSSLKFFLVCTLTIVLSLVSYQWCVRYTLLGTLLNGPRRRPERAVDAILVEPVGEVTPPYPQPQE